MTRDELVEYRRFRWEFVKHGDGRVLRRPRYLELDMKFWEGANKLAGMQRNIYVLYYYRAKSMVQVSFETDYSERSIKRIKRNALEKITLNTEV